MNCRNLFVLFAAGASTVFGAPPWEPMKPLALWPGGAPGETAKLEERDTQKPTDRLVGGHTVIKLGGVSNPTVTLYPAPKAKNTGTAMLVMPGGGYSILAMDLEGTEVCEWLNTIGITAVLLKYRVPAQANSPRAGAPLQDGQRAVRLMRAHAKDWGVDPAKIGAIGFSAGAHLAALLSNQYGKKSYEPVDEADTGNCRPDFVALIYPGLLTEHNGGMKLAEEMAVTANTSPSFLVQAEDDPVKVENSLLYYSALKAAKVPAEMHIFAQGGHGYGLRHTEMPVTDWPKLAERWLRTLGMLPER